MRADASKNKTREMEILQNIYKSRIVCTLLGPASSNFEMHVDRMPGPVSYQKSYKLSVQSALTV